MLARAPGYAHRTILRLLPAAFLALAIAPAARAQSCAGDLNGDGVVNAQDLAVMLAAWGTASPEADVNGDGIVDGKDLAILLGSWNG